MTNRLDKWMKPHTVYQTLERFDGVDVRPDASLVLTSLDEIALVLPELLNHYQKELQEAAGSMDPVPEDLVPEDPASADLTPDCVTTIRRQQRMGAIEGALSWLTMGGMRGVEFVLLPDEAEEVVKRLHNPPEHLSRDEQNKRVMTGARMASALGSAHLHAARQANILPRPRKPAPRS